MVEANSCGSAAPLVSPKLFVCRSRKVGLTAGTPDEFAWMGWGEIDLWLNIAETVVAVNKDTSHAYSGASSKPRAQIFRNMRRR
jgi:hypothetical protein